MKGYNTMELNKIELYNILTSLEDETLQKENFFNGLEYQDNFLDYLIFLMIFLMI